MCKDHNPRVIDKCMRKLIINLKLLLRDTPYKPVACCCGHGKYPMTIVCRFRTAPTALASWELVSHKLIPRSKRFYKKDKEGYYYIPETLESAK